MILHCDISIVVKVTMLLWKITNFHDRKESFGFNSFIMYFRIELNSKENKMNKPLVTFFIVISFLVTLVSEFSIRFWQQFHARVFFLKYLVPWHQLKDQLFYNRILIKQFFHSYQLKSAEFANVVGSVGLNTTESNSLYKAYKRHHLFRALL